MSARQIIESILPDAKKENRAGAKCSKPAHDCFVAVGAMLALFGVALATFQLFDLHINLSPSFPRGIYRLVHREPSTGDLVFYVPSDAPIFRVAQANGYFKRGNYLLKKLMAASGDVITISADGVTVNGATTPNSKPLKFDGAGRPLAAAELNDYRLAVGEVLLMSDYSPQSWDARYFGVQNEAGVKGAAHPVWIFD